MVGSSSKKERKDDFSVKLAGLLSKYNKIMVVGADNVGSHHMQNIRISLRGKGILLMGKNTMIRRVIKTQFKQFEPLLPHVYENIGLLFTNQDLIELREVVLLQKVPAMAKAGAVAPIDVIVPAGDTGLEPTQTAFLQALNIATRINKGQIMILNPKQVITKGEKVGASEATLLQKLKIKPFSYGLSIRQIYEDGAVYHPQVLDFTPAYLAKKVTDAASRIACVSLAIGFPTLPSVPHLLSRAFKNILSIALDTAITFPQAEEIKELLENPEALAAAVAAQSSVPEKQSREAPAAAAAAAEPEEKEEESDEDMGFGLFD